MAVDPSAVMTPAGELKVDDFVDLEDCVLAKAEDREHIFAFEYAVVVEIEDRGNNLILIHFDKTSIAFPADYMVARVPG